MALTTLSDAKTQSGWQHDALADRFNTHKSLDEIHPDAAVNIYLGWPTFFEQIKYQAELLGKSQLNILDFGCGAGEFCNKMHMKGHKVVGIDKSSAMLNVAKSNSPSEITYCLKDKVDTGEECSMFVGHMDVVTAIHSFDWNENMDEIIKQLAQFLVPNGLMIFAVFTKDHIIESLKAKDLFENFDSETNPTKGFANFDGIQVPVFVKEPSYYDKLFKSINFAKVLEFYPPFPKAFLTKYDWKAGTSPEMVILGYRKSAK